MTLTETSCLIVADTVKRSRNSHLGGGGGGGDERDEDSGCCRDVAVMGSWRCNMTFFIFNINIFARTSLTDRGGEIITRGLKQTTTTTATRTSSNKRFNEQNNSCARAL